MYKFLKQTITSILIFLAVIPHVAFTLRFLFNPYADWVYNFARFALDLPDNFWINDYSVRRECFFEIVVVYSIIFVVFCLEKYKRRKHDFLL